MTTTRITDSDNEYFEHGIDASLFRDTETIEGLAFVQNVRNGTTSNEKPVVRFSLRGKHNTITQANLYLQNRQVFKNEDALYLLHKVVYVKGIISVFNSHCILELECIQEFKSDLTADNFFSKNNNIRDYADILKQQIKIINEANVTKSLFLNSPDTIIDFMSKAHFEEEGSLVGDPLIVTSNIVRDFLEGNKKDYNEAFLTILLMYIHCTFLNNQQATDNNFTKVRNIINFCDKQELTTPQMQAIDDFLNSSYFFSQPKTNFGKVFGSGLEHYKEVLISRNLEHETNMVYSTEHIRLR